MKKLCYFIIFADNSDAELKWEPQGEGAQLLGEVSNYSQCMKYIKNKPESIIKYFSTIWFVYCCQQYLHWLLYLIFLD